MDPFSRGFASSTSPSSAHPGRAPPSCTCPQSRQACRLGDRGKGQAVVFITRMVTYAQPAVQHWNRVIDTDVPQARRGGNVPQRPTRGCSNA
eukprot:13285083-Heterocapsa_arctica.AAC.1